MCRFPQPLSNIELLNMALGIEDEQAFVKKSIAAKGEFLGIGAFRPHMANRAVPYDQDHQGEVKGTIVEHSDIEVDRDMVVSSKKNKINMPLWCSLYRLVPNRCHCYYP